MLFRTVVALQFSTPQMAAITSFLRIQLQSATTHGGGDSDKSTPFLHRPRLSLSSFEFPSLQRRRGVRRSSPKTSPFSVYSSPLSSANPPTSKEEAILQARTCLSTTLEKPLNNPKVAGKLRKLKQPKFRVEIPLIDDSPDSLSQLAKEVFQDLPIRRKGSSSVKIILLWPNPDAANRASKFKSTAKIQIDHADMSGIFADDARAVSSADLAIILAPESSQLEAIKMVTEILYPKPVVLFNPRWAFEEEENFEEFQGFVGSFEVIYSFLGLEVKGILKKRQGVVFKCVRDGVLSGEGWTVLVEEEGNLKVVSKFKSRPAIGEVENVLYNLMAINSPITKSAKFFRDLVSRVTGKK